MKRLYLAFCRRWGPSHLTYSAWAWQCFAVTGNSWLRDRIDGAWLFWGGGRDHCQSQWSKEARRD